MGCPQLYKIHHNALFIKQDGQYVDNTVLPHYTVVYYHTVLYYRTVL